MGGEAVREAVAKLMEGIGVCVEAAARPTMGPQETAHYAAAARDLAAVQYYLAAVDRVQNDPNAWPRLPGEDR